MGGFEAWGTGSSYGESMSSKTKTKRCHHSHPPLKIGGGVIYGGACAEPCGKADYNILLDGFEKGDELPPWEGRFIVRFPIRDGDVPSTDKLKKLVDWIGEELAKGKKFHIGCFAGHGRTGTVLAAIVAKVDGEKDAIRWLRENYCKKAVESKKQVDMLVKHFGVKKAKPSKPGYAGTGSVAKHLPWTGGGKTTSKKKPTGGLIDHEKMVTADPLPGKSIFDTP